MQLLTLNKKTLILCLGFFFFSLQAQAEINNAGVLDDVLSRYSDAADTWADVITTKASWLFWTLTTISMVWTFGLMALRNADIGEFFSEFIRFIMFTGFFWWLLSNGPHFATDIINSLRTIAGSAIGDKSLTPSSIVDIGFDIFFKVLDKSSVWSPTDSLIGVLISMVILVVMALIGVNMLLLLVSGWILAYAGIFFLGFGGSRWTSDMAISYYKTVLNIAAQLFTMVLLVGIGKSFVDRYYNGMSADIISIKELGVMMIVSLVLLALVNKLPAMIGGLAMGGGTHSLGNGFGAGAAMAAATMAGAAIGSVGTSIASGAANIAGGAQAIKAAFSAASAAASAGGDTSEGSGSSATAGGSDESSRDSGSGLAAAMGDSGGSSGGDSNSASKPTVSDGDSSGGSSKSGGFSTSSDSGGASGGNRSLKAGKILGKASWQAVKNKAADRISQTAGGKIAAAINAETKAKESKADSKPKESENYLAPGKSEE